MITMWIQNSEHIPDIDMKRSWHKFHYFTNNVFCEKKKGNPYFESTYTSFLKK